MKRHMCLMNPCVVCARLNEIAGVGDLNVPMVVIGLDFGREPTAYEHHAFTHVEQAVIPDIPQDK